MLLLSGCVAANDPAVKDAPTVTATQTATETVQATPSPSSMATPPPAPPSLVVAKTCADYSTTQLGDSSAEHAALSAAAVSALPAGVELKPGVQVVESLEPGKIEAVVRICQDTPMSGPQLIEIASAIAVSVKADPVSELLEVLVVSAWHPDGEYLAQGETVTTDYGLYTWDPSAAAPMSSNWE